MRHQEDRLKNFTQEEHHTWRRLFLAQEPKRDEQIVPIFSDGIKTLELTPDRIPDLERVNRLLHDRTGFRGVPVTGLEDPASLFRLLASRKFPIGNFIRDAKDLVYTPAPDVFHDLYGHLPFLVNPDYAEFCQRFGETALKYLGNPDFIREFDRLFWFTIEFGMMKTKQGLRVFGAGIASSHAECAYALSGKPEIVPFDLERIRVQDFKIDDFQLRLFEINKTDELFACLSSFEQGLWFSPSLLTDQVVS